MNPSGARLSWLLWIASGIGPYPDQAVDFSPLAPEPKQSAANRTMAKSDLHEQARQALFAHLMHPEKK